jgi:hypothetical protein
LAVDAPYALSVPDGPLRQGEILAPVEQFIVQISSQHPEEPPNVRVKKHPFAVVLSQDCDLAQDFNARSSGDVLLKAKLLMPNIILCEVDLAENMKGGGTIAPGSDIWKRIVQNKDERFQYLREVTAGLDAGNTGIPPLLVDFKRTFTVPTDTLYEQLQRITKRRTVLISPYLEHLSARYASFISRVALPRDHHA